MINNDEVRRRRRKLRNLKRKGNKTCCDSVITLTVTLFKLIGIPFLVIGGVQQTHKMSGITFENLLTEYLEPVRHLIVNFLFLLVILLQTCGLFFQMEFLDTFLGVSLFYLFIGSMNMDWHFDEHVENCYKEVEDFNDLINVKACRKATVPFGLYSVGAILLAIFVLYMLGYLFYYIGYGFYMCCCYEKPAKYDTQYKESNRKRRRQFNRKFTSKGLEPGLEYRIDRSTITNDEETESLRFRRKYARMQRNKRMEDTSEVALSECYSVVF